MEDTRTPSRFRVQHPLAGRFVGVVWDLGVSMLALLAIPAVALTIAWGLLNCSMWLLPLALGLTAVSVVSVLFGVVWSLRGCVVNCPSED